MKKGICCAGNMIVDITYPIETWPKQNELTHITEGITRSTGGSVCNTISDLARLDPRAGRSWPPALPARRGRRLSCRRGGNTKTSTFPWSSARRHLVYRRHVEQPDKRAHIFQYAGGNAYYGEDDIDWDKLNVDIFHIGYILLLPHLDEPDAEYGTKMARLLYRAQQAG